MNKQNQNQVPEVDNQEANVINATPSIKPEDLVSPINFAKILGKPAQYIYQMLRDKKFPQETYVIVQAGDKERPMLIKDAALNWFSNRPTRSAATHTRVISNADEVIARMVDMFKVVAKENPKNAAINQLAEGLEKMLAGTVTKSADNAQ